MSGGKLAAGAVLCVPMLVLAMMFSSGGGGQKGEDPKATAGGAVPANVPAEYQSDVSRAGSICPEITPTVIAVQLSHESSWDPGATSPAGAKGLAQFMPDTWASSGKDGDGDGIADPLNPHDAIFSQGHFMCTLAGEMQTLLDEGRVHGELLDLALAAYNAGSGAVQEAGGVPDFTETRKYVESITATIAADAGGGGGDGSRESTILTTARSKIGMPYVWGAASDSVGYDCSGLVQTAYAAVGTQLPHSSAAQCSAGTRVSVDQAKPGDIVCWSGHVAIYAGSYRIVEAATEGTPVRETDLYDMAGGPYFVHID